MHRLLTDETLHVQPQLVVLDQRQRLLEYLDKKLLARGQQQMQNVEDMSCQRLVGHIVKRQVGPVELDIARLEDQALVIKGRVVRTDCLVVNRNHVEPPQIWSV